MTVISEAAQTAIPRSFSLSAKAYFFALVGVYVAVFCLLAGLNVVVDPYGAFGTDFLAANNIAERFVKIRWLDAHHADYDTYILGSSTVGLTPPSMVEKYLPGSRIYNLYVSNGDMADFVEMLQYMIRNNWTTKTIVLQLDPYSFLCPPTGKINDYIFRELPEVSGESKLKFYADYLLSFSPKWVWKKINANLHHRPAYIDVQHTGTWAHDRAELFTPAQWAATEPTFQTKVAPEYKGEALAAKVALLKQFLTLAHDNDIKIIVMTSATNHISMDYLDLPAYEKFLEDVAQLTDYWDFGGYTTITDNNENYYDMYHARPGIAKLMLARVFSDPSVSMPADFGVFVTAENVHDVIEQRRRNVEGSR